MPPIIRSGDIKILMVQSATTKTLKKVKGQGQGLLEFERTCHKVTHQSVEINFILEIGICNIQGSYKNLINAAAVV